MVVDVDILSGTSAGGINAALLIIPESPGSTCVDPRPLARSWGLDRASEIRGTRNTVLCNMTTIFAALAKRLPKLATGPFSTTFPGGAAHPVHHPVHHDDVFASRETSRSHRLIRHSVQDVDRRGPFTFTDLAPGTAPALAIRSAQFRLAAHEKRTKTRCA